MEEDSGLRAFIAKRDVVLDPATVGARALEELEEKYLIARDLDAATVLSRIQAVVERNDGSILSGGELSYQLPSRAPEQVEYDPLLRQLCLRRGRVDSCEFGDQETMHRATVITTVLAILHEALAG